MVDSIYDRPDLESEGLLPIHENKERDPLEKQIRLAQPPWVAPIPYGPRAGEHAFWIRTSFSPLDCFPFDHAASRRDSKDGLTMTVQEILDLYKNKIPNTVYIVGGDPIYKWDDELSFLVEELYDAGAFTITIETSGVTFPNICQSILDNGTGFFGPYVVIKPQLFNAVPDDEWGGYKQHLPKVLANWKEILLEGSYHWHFDIDCNLHSAIAHQLNTITLFMTDLFKESMGLEYIIFVSKKTNYDDYYNYQRLSKEVGKIMINYPHAHVQTQIVLE